MAVRIRRESIQDTIRRLRTYTRRMELRYECTSEFMTSAVVNGHAKETAEVARWLTAHRSLERILARMDSTTQTS